MEIGDQVGPYELVQVLGEGAYGKVYLAKDVDLERPVAIKVAKPREEAAFDQVDTFLAEARRVAQLQHPAIVTIHDVSRGDTDAWYLVMDYIDGPSLADVYADGQMNPADLAKLLIEVAEGIHYAHCNGILHRDLKPANVLLDKDEKHARIVDFGMALQEREQTYAPRKPAGTPYSMAPEQIRGETHRLDARTDIWSLGVLMYEGFSRERPFNGEHVDELFDAILHDDPPPMMHSLPVMSEELQRICFKCLSKRMGDRYATAAEVGSDLRHWLAEFSASVSGVGQANGAPELPAVAEVAQHVVPKGLRSFSSEDAAFFLGLLPGPWNRDGLPESICTWIHLIENKDRLAERAVLVLYGPSGSGKSSFVRAGLIPFGKHSNKAICIDSSVGDLEQNILKNLSRICHDLPAFTDLVQACSAIRRGRTACGDQKVLIVLDQFEQWLHANNGRLSGPLATALRQCDGERLQCLLIVRSDFWLGISRFLRELELPLIEGSNSGHLDLFDVRHTRRVLAAFGRSYGCLPPAHEPLSGEHRQFLEKAAEQIATDGWVIPVRLALFAEMMKGQDWTIDALQKVGGERGLRVAYLNQVFDSPLAGPNHRRFRKQAEAVLRALLPETDVEIKGQCRTRQELQEISGLSGDDKRFAEVMDILDAQLRLITPAEETEGPNARVEGAQTYPPTFLAPQQSFQLTHDYLVPALRDWLTRTEQATWQGRARLRLAERAALWNSRPENRHLPTPWEWAAIRFLTRSKDWTSSQRKMMRRASRYLARRVLVGAACASLIAWVGWESFGRMQARVLRDNLLRAPDEDVAEIVNGMADYRRWVNSSLQQTYHDAATNGDARKQLRASLGLLPADAGQVPYLLERMLAGTPSEVVAIRTAIELEGNELSEPLWDILLDQRADSSQRLRAACFLATHATSDDRWQEASDDIPGILVTQPTTLMKQWGEALRPISRLLLPELAKLIVESRDGSHQRAMMELYAELAADAIGDGFSPLVASLKSPGTVNRDLDSARRQATALTALAVGGRWEHVWPNLRHTPDPTLRTYLVAQLGSGAVPVQAIAERSPASQEVDASCRRALLLILGETPEIRLPRGERDRLLPGLLETYRTDPDPGVHASARWLLQQWGQEPKALAIDKEMKSGVAEDRRQWYVTRQGQTMVIASMEAPYEGEPLHREQSSEPQRTIALGWQEVTVAEFRRFRPDHAVDNQTALSDDCPVNLVRWYDAAAYCNWLSKEEGIPEDQWCYLPNEEGKYEAGMKIKSHAESLTGYRLPTSAEWEYASRAASTTPWFMGEGAEMLDRYAWSITNAAMRTHPVRQLRPNDFGLFDALGNVWEWCQTPCDIHGNVQQGDRSNEVIVDDQTNWVLRGGTYLNDAMGTAPDNRNGNPPQDRTGADGFRIARTLPQ